MTTMSLLRHAAVVVACLMLGMNAYAQPIDALGTRAQGMAGAFVALADDPTAVYWNPAGLAKGPFFGVSLDGSTTERVPEALDPDAARWTGLMVAASMPALGFIYYRLQDSAVLSADAGLSQDRNDPRSSRLDLRSLVTHSMGASLVQSLSDGLAVGTTLKYVRGYAAQAFVSAPADSSDVGAWLDMADALEGLGSGAFDMDVGFLGVFGPVRIGVVARHLTEPTFATQEGADFRLERQVRAGVAVRPSERVTVAADFDVVESETLSGQPQRAVALGAESALWRGLTLRGGVRVSLVGEKALTPAVGASASLGRRLWIDGQWTLGDAGRDTGWGIGLRIAL